MSGLLSDPLFYALAITSTVGIALLMILYRRGEEEDARREEMDRGEREEDAWAPELGDDYSQKLRLLFWADQVVCPGCRGVINMRDKRALARRITPLSPSEWLIETIHTACGTPILSNRLPPADSHIAAEVLSSQYRREEPRPPIQPPAIQIQPAQAIQPQQQAPPPAQASQEPQPQQPRSSYLDAIQQLKLISEEDLRRHLWSCGSCPYRDPATNTCQAQDKSGRRYKTWRATAACKWWLQERLVRYVRNGVFEVVA